MGLIEVSQNVSESLSTTEEQQQRRLNAERRAAATENLIDKRD
jgi:hypothetical protein